MTLRSRHVQEDVTLPRWRGFHGRFARFYCTIIVPVGCELNCRMAIRLVKLSGRTDHRSPITGHRSPACDFLHGSRHALWRAVERLDLQIRRRVLHRRVREGLLEEVGIRLIDLDDEPLAGGVEMQAL